MRTTFHHLRARWADDEGLSLVEVMVAMTVLAITMTTVGSSVVRSLSIARDSRETVLAANIAQFELERLRAIPFLEWVQSAQYGSVEMTRVGTFTSAEGLQYTIDRAATWVASGADTDGCSTAASGQGSGADYILVRQRIEFPGRTLQPVENQTIVTPRLDFFDPYTGNLAVIVRDRDGVGRAGIPVSIAGLSGSESNQTDANGCAFFAYLTVDPDTPANNGYTVTIDVGGNIDRATGLQVIDDTVTVASQTTTVVEYEYDEGVDYRLAPTVAAPVSGCTVTLVTLASPAGGHALECRDDTTGIAVSVLGQLWQPIIPDDLGWRLYNPNYNVNGHFEPAVVDLSLPADLVATLYPYVAGFGVHAGRCRASDPDTLGGARQTLPAPPGADLTETVELSEFRITTTDILTPTAIWAVMPPDAGCAVEQRIYIGHVSLTDPLHVVLPKGDWELDDNDVLTPVTLALCTEPGQLPLLGRCESN